MRVPLILPLILALLLTPVFAFAGPAVCRNGSVLPSVIRKAAAGLPMSARIPMNVGAHLPAGIRTAPLPKVLGQVLPQYPGYRAVRTRKVVAIVDPGSRRVVYLAPLNLTQPLDCPDS